MIRPFFYRLVLTVGLILCFATHGEAKVKLPVLLADGMVLQREQPVVIRGTAGAEEEVTVTFQKKKYTVTAASGGNWTVTLPAMKAGGPYTMTINDRQINDILIGDVWLCSGQSNMELPVRRVLDLYAGEVKDYENTNIRYVKVPVSQNYHAPQPDIPAVGWKELTPENALDYSALCYFFAIDLYDKIKVPIGIINSSVGGSPIESWISEKGLKPFPHYLHERDLHRSDIYMANVAKLEMERRTLWNSILYREDPGLHGKWFIPEYDDSGWEQTDLDNNAWACDGNSHVNGSFWFRKDFDLPASLAGKSAILRLGCIVDADSVFVNGEFVGTTAYQYPPRIYNVPSHVLKPGKNTVTVRLISYSGRPGFVDDKPYKLIVGEEEIDLHTGWKYKMGVRMPALQSVGTYQQRPTGFYNGMIAPLQHLAFKGVIWYQGESNTDRYHEYGRLLTSLIDDWRTLLKQPELPFLIVQLPNFLKEISYPAESHWANMREQQQKVAQTVPHTGLAVTIDTGEWNDIHPLNKKDIGRRLSLQAQRIIYGNKKIIADGPIPESVKQEGNKLVLSFKEGTGCLMPADTLKGFAVAGKDNMYKWAKAKVENGKVIVWNDEIEEPVKVRYAWADNPGKVNLKNMDGLPASPFQAGIE